MTLTQRYVRLKRFNDGRHFHARCGNHGCISSGYEGSWRVCDGRRMATFSREGTVRLFSPQNAACGRTRLILVELTWTTDNQLPPGDHDVRIRATRTCRLALHGPRTLAAAHQTLAPGGDTHTAEPIVPYSPRWRPQPERADLAPTPGPTFPRRPVPVSSTALTRASREG